MTSAESQDANPTETLADTLTGFKLSNWPGGNRRGFSIPLADAMDCQSALPDTSAKPCRVAPAVACVIGVVPGGFPAVALTSGVANQTRQIRGGGLRSIWAIERLESFAE